jgi:ATP-dependent RNA helicase DHX57
MKQRRGRAGRVREGTCYKLISRATFDTLNEHSEPEIQRAALDQTVLQLIFIGVEPRLGSFTNTLLDPPNRNSLEAAIFSLQKMGAVERGPNDDVVVTPLGAHLAGIPAPPLVGKRKCCSFFLYYLLACLINHPFYVSVIVMGSILGCRSAALAMAAGISLGRSFYNRVHNGGNNFESSAVDDMVRRKVLEQRASSAKEAGNSDHALSAFVFLKWQQTEKGIRSRFCESLGVSSNALHDMALLFNQLDASLREAGFTSSPESDRHASSWRIIQACAVSAMSPNQLVKVRRPVIKYYETAEGARQKDGEARELSFFIRADSEKEERVFIHPSSINFSTGNYSCPVLVYNSMVRTTKPYLRDVTECSAYALLLFGGALEVQASKGVVVVDRWVELAANARIGSLVGGLRRRIDSLLAEKIVSPTIDLTTYPEMKLVVKLIRTDGLGS